MRTLRSNQENLAILIVSAIVFVVWTILTASVGGVIGSAAALLFPAVKQYVAVHPGTAGAIIGALYPLTCVTFFSRKEKS